MTCHWSDSTFTRCIIIRGWPRKRWAETYRDVDCRWYFTATRMPVGFWIEMALDSLRAHAVREAPWRDVAEMPGMRVVE